MKNDNLKLWLPYLLGLTLMTAVTWMLIHMLGSVHWVLCILIALLLCVAAILCHAFSKGCIPLYIFGYALNAIGSGCAIATLYAKMGWNATLSDLMWAVLPAAVLGLLLVLGYFGEGKLWRKVWGFVMLAVVVIGLIFAIAVWIKWNRVWGSLSFFSGICLLFFLMACILTPNEPVGRWRYLSFSGFWAFAVIAVVVVLLLSEGEILDGLDFDFDFGKKKKRK